MENVAERLKNFYEQNKGYMATLDSHDANYFAPYLHMVSRWAHKRLHPPLEILELGCGIGASSKYVSELDIGNITGTDFSQTYIECAKKKYKRNNLKYRVADATRLPFPDASFDLICSYEFIEHVPEVNRTIKEMMRVCKPSGLVIVVSPALLSPLIPFGDFIKKITGRGTVSLWGQNTRAIAQLFFHHMSCCISKMFQHNPIFLYRQPDLSDTSKGGDMDAVYWSHPLDIKRSFDQWKIHQWVGFGTGRTKLYPYVLRGFSPIIGLVAQKPGNDP